MPENDFPEATFGLEENIAAALSYVLGWLSGLIFYLSEDENTFVRFHAMQSIIVSGSITVLVILISILFGRIPLIGFLAGIFTSLIQFGGFILMVFLLVKAFQGEKYKVPLAGKKAENYSGGA